MKEETSNAEGSVGKIRGGPDHLYPFPPQPTHLPRLILAIKDAGAALTIFGVVIFIISVAVNESVFRFWGLSFLGIADPQDVVASGIQALFYLIIFWTPGAYAYAIVRYNSHDTAVGWLSFYAGLILLVDLILLALGVGSGLVVVAVLGWWSGLCHGWRRGHGGIHGLAALVAAASTFGTAGFLPLQAYLLAHHGYLGTPQFLTTPDLNYPGCARRVLWVGDHAVVVDCGSTPRSRHIVVLLDRQTARLDNAFKASDQRQIPGSAPASVSPRPAVVAPSGVLGSLR